MPHRFRTWSTSPLGVFVLVLLMMFIAEGAIMLALPHIIPWPAGSLAESMADAGLLAATVAPGLWFMVVGPLRGMFGERGRLLARVFDAHEEERRRLARDLHDGLGQHLTAVLVGLRSVEREAVTEHARTHAAELLRLTSTSIDEVRRLARGLRPGVLEDFGLATAAQRLCEDTRSAHGLHVAFSSNVRPEDRFNPAVETAAYRLLQESLTNVARHARARSVEVNLSVEGRSLRLMVRDDGVGIDPAAPPEPGRAAAPFGLSSMRERAELLGGTLEICSAPGRGTTVEASLPAAS